MALKGDLASVDLAQVFQMLALNRKVGMLSIQSPRTWRALYFDNRGVTLYYNEHTLLDRILTNLVRSGQLVNSAVLELREQASEGDGALVDGILAAGYVDEETLDELFQTELEEDIYDLFFWKHARFEFFEGATSFEGREGVINPRFTFATDTLIMEAARRIDEWSCIKELIPGSLEVYRLASKDSVVDDLDDGTIAILDLVDGRRNITRLIEISAIAPFHVYKSLSKLLESKMIEPLPADILISTGKQCTHEGRLEDAMNLFEKAIAIGEGIPEAHFLAAEAYETALEFELTVYHLKCVSEFHASEGDLKQAVEILRRAIDIIPTDLAARERLVELTVGHPEFKDEDFDPAAQGKILVDLYLEVGEVERVRGILERLLRENPADLELKKILINVHSKAGDTRRVIELFQSIAEDLVAESRPIEAVKYLQKILMLDRSRSDISDRIKSLYELDERRRSRKRSLLALGLLFCVLSVLGAVYYLYEQHARGKFEGLDVVELLEEKEFDLAAGVYQQFITDYPLTMVIRDAKAELARVESLRRLNDAKENLDNEAESRRVAKLRKRYQELWLQHRREFKAGDPERAMRTVEEVLRLIQEADQPEDLRWARNQKVTKSYEELKEHLSKAVSLDRRAREAWKAGDWQTARIHWFELVTEYSLTSTAENVLLPVLLNSKPPGAKILKYGKPLTRDKDGKLVEVFTPAVVLSRYSRPESFSLEKDGFESLNLKINALGRLDGVYEFVLKIIPDLIFEFGAPVQTAVGTDGKHLAVGLRSGKLGYSQVARGARTYTVSMKGLSEIVGKPEVSNGRVFFVTNEGNLQCMVVNRTFGKPWVVPLASTTVHKLAVRDGRVILVDIDGWLRCYDQRNGAHKLWSWSKNLGGDAAGRPIMREGRVYVALKTGRILVFKTSGTAVHDYQIDSRICTPAFPAGQSLIVGCTDGTLRAIWFGTGQERWRLDLGRAVEETDIALTVGSLIVLGKGNRLLRIDPDSKAVLATVQLPHPLHTGPVIAGDRVFTVVRKDLGRGKYSDLLQAWRVSDLSPLWEYENGKPFRGPVSTDGTSVYLPASGGELLVF